MPQASNKLTLMDIMCPWIKEKFPVIHMDEKTHHIELFNGPQTTNSFSGLIGWVSNATVGLLREEDESSAFEQFKPTDRQFFDKIEARLKFITTTWKSIQY